MVSKLSNWLKLAIIPLLCIFMVSGNISNKVATSKYDVARNIIEMQTAVVMVTVSTHDAEYYGTGWAFDHYKDSTLIVTAAHLVNENYESLYVKYWDGEGGWKECPATVVYMHDGRFNGDFAILVINKLLNILELGSGNAYEIGDEVIIAGIQHPKPPAMISIGFVQDISIYGKVIIHGWSFRGHSGGPIVHRRTGKVIGMISMFASQDDKHASLTECTDIEVIKDAVRELLGAANE